MGVRAVPVWCGGGKKFGIRDGRRDKMDGHGI